MFFKKMAGVARGRFPCHEKRINMADETSPCHPWRRGKDEKGQALVEMALMLPVLVLLLMGIFEFGRVFNAYLVVNNAAWQGLRIGVVGGTDDEIKATVAKVVYPTVEAAETTIAIQPGAGSRVRGEAMTVQVGYPVIIYTPVIKNIISSPLTVTGKITGRVE